jgi:hypothetical protein
MSNTEHTLLSTDDAMVWAEEFCRIFNGKIVAADEYSGGEHGPVDPGTMVGWFAGAMVTAINLYERKKLHEKGEKTEVEEFIDRWDAEHPDGEDVEQDPTGEITLEESFVEGFREGRPNPA